MASKSVLTMVVLRHVVSCMSCMPLMLMPPDVMSCHPNNSWQVISLCQTVPCHAMSSCQTMPCHHVKPCHVIMSNHAMSSCQTMPCHHVKPCHAIMSNHAMPSCQTMPCHHVKPCHAIMSNHAMSSCQTMPCHPNTTSCNVISGYDEGRKCPHILP